MSEKLFRFLLSELHTVRIYCARCKVTLEIAKEDLARKFPTRVCPVCSEEFNAPKTPDGYNPFQELAKLMHFFDKVKDQGTISFTLPDTETK